MVGWCVAIAAASVPLAVVVSVAVAVKVVVVVVGGFGFSIQVLRVRTLYYPSQKNLSVRPQHLPTMSAVLPGPHQWSISCDIAIE